MNKNNIIGFVLIAAVLIGYSFWSRPSAEQQAEMARQDSIAAVAQQKAEAAQQMAEEKKTAEAKQRLLPILQPSSIRLCMAPTRPWC